MGNRNDSEQWLLDGNCDVCRRNGYCKKWCTKVKRDMKELDKSVRADIRKSAQYDATQEEATEKYLEAEFEKMFAKHLAAK